jgi:hypothetical protein
MVKKSTLTLDKEFTQYCELNKIEDVGKLAKETFNRGFSILKYGETPTGNSKVKVVEKEVIKEVIIEKIVEVIKEVPVEVIKEIIKEVPIEVIKEVPVEIKGDTQIITKEVIKEVPVEKIVEVVKETENTQEIERLTKENKKLQSDLDKIVSSLEKMNKAKFMKNSDLGSLYDE